MEKSFRIAYSDYNCGVKKALSEAKLSLSVHYIEHTSKYINQEKTSRMYK